MLIDLAKTATYLIRETWFYRMPMSQGIMLIVRNPRRTFVRQSVFLSLLFLTTMTASKAEESVKIQYVIPEFGMKLIVVNEDDISMSLFQTALDNAVVTHIDSYLARSLPKQSSALINQATFDEVFLESVVAPTPIDPSQTQGIKLSIILARYTGVGKFIIPSTLAKAAVLDPKTKQNSTDLFNFVKDALKEDGGFWELASALTNDVILSRTGKLQTAVGNIIVGEGDLVSAGDKPTNKGNGMSFLASVALGVLVVLLIVVVGGALYILHQRKKERDIEREKMLRRQSYKIQRKKNAGNLNTSQNCSQTYQESMGSSSTGTSLDGSWLDLRAKQVSSVPNRLDARKGQSKTLKVRTHSKPAPGAPRSNTNLLHCIAEEPFNHDDSSLEADPNDNEDVERVFGARHANNGNIESFNWLNDSTSSNNSAPSYNALNTNADKSTQNKKTANYVASNANAEGATRTTYVPDLSYTSSASKNGAVPSCFANSLSSSSLASANNMSASRVTYNNNASASDLNCSIDVLTTAFGMMNREGFDTLNMEELDLSSAGTLSYGEGGNSLKLVDFMDLREHGDHLDVDIEAPTTYEPGFDNNSWSLT